jgi:putative methyltransferase (TIGR04325 family)
MSIGKNLWEGVYKSFSEAGGDYDAFDSEIWITKQKSRIVEGLEKHSSATFASKDYPLPLVVSMALAEKGSLEILDFGGGMGLQYLEMIAKVPEAEHSVRYHIVDGAASIHNRPKEMDQFKNLHFSSDLPDVIGKMDIVHIGSTLQYIENWQGLLADINTRYQPQYFVFSDLLAGDVPTFVSHQIFYDKRIPHLFINLSEFISFIREKVGMSMLFQTKFIRAILNQEDIFPNQSLPKSHRIDRPYNLIFSKCKM